MRAAWYERQGDAQDVLQVGERDRPEPRAGEVRVRIHASGVNPSDTYGRSGRQAPMAFPWVIPHQDGAGMIDAVGGGVPTHQSANACGCTRRHSIARAAPRPSTASYLPIARCDCHTVLISIAERAWVFRQ